MWKNVVEEGKSKTTKTGTRFACRITKERKNTHWLYLILIASLRQQRLRERTLNMTLHVHCLSCRCFSSFTPQRLKHQNDPNQFSHKHWSVVITAEKLPDSILKYFVLVIKRYVYVDVVSVSTLTGLTITTTVAWYSEGGEHVTTLSKRRIFETNLSIHTVSITLYNYANRSQKKQNT